MMTSRSDRPLIIWRITDGKPGHEKQTLGLARALLKSRPGKCIDLAAPARSEALKQWLLGRFSAGLGLPAPDILLGAGHATHFALLAARRAYGGKTVVLMKPSLPLSWFDLCVIPEHDNPPQRRNVIPVQGVLNNVQASQATSLENGLMLIGGVSSHYGWDDISVGAAVVKIAQSTPQVSWQLTTSRRTPATFLSALPQPLPKNLEMMPHTTTGPGWLEQALAESGQVWVTEDSVSMLYEALTAGAGVGLLRLPSARDTRVRRGVGKLIENGWVTPFEAWRNGEPPPLPEREFNEAKRVAEQILTSLENHATT
jgi:mitochondrial fission protein ELM1